MNNRLHGLALSFAIAIFLGILPAFGADSLPAQAVTKEMRCPVCGMYPARYPKWMAQIVFSDHSLQVFESPAELFRFLQNMARYDKKHEAKDVGAIYFSDYAKGGWIESKRTFFASGSSAKGPMNDYDLPAFDSKEAAEQFVRDHGGNVLAYGKISPEVLKELGNAHQHMHQ